jgi:hypothetical protein
MRQLGQRHGAGAARQIHLQGADGIDGIARRFLQAHGDVEAPVAFEIRIDGVARQRRLDCRVDIGHVDAQAGDALAVDNNVEFALPADFHGAHVGRTRNAAQDGGDLLALLRQHVQVGAVDLHGDLAPSRRTAPLPRCPR